MMFTRRWKDKLESISDAFWGLSRRIDRLESYSPRATEKRITELEERISFQEEFLESLLYAVLRSDLSPDFAKKLIAIRQIYEKDKGWRAGKVTAELEFNQAERIIDGVKGNK